MTISAPPAPRVALIRRVLTVASNGRHGTVENREVARYVVLIGEETVAEFETKGHAEAYAAGWEGHRTHTKAIVEQVLGVAP